MTPDLYVGEFLTDRKSSIAPEGWSPKERVMSDDRLIVALRERSDDALGVAIFHSGVHPRWTVVFLRSRTNSFRLQIIATSTYWGAVQVKRVGEMSREAFENLRERLAARLDCRTTPKSRDMSWGFSHWRDGAIVYCSGKYFGENQRFFDESITPVMNATVVVYSVWKDEKR